MGQDVRSAETEQHFHSSDEPLRLSVDDRSIGVSDHNSPRPNFPMLNEAMDHVRIIFGKGFCDTSNRRSEKSGVLCRLVQRTRLREQVLRVRGRRLRWLSVAIEVARGVRNNRQPSGRSVQSTAWTMGAPRLDCLRNIRIYTAFLQGSRLFHKTN